MKKTIKFIKKIVSFIIFILIFSISFLSLLLFLSKDLTSTNTVNRVFNKVDFLNLKASEVYNKEDIPSNLTNPTVIDVIIDKIGTNGEIAKDILNDDKTKRELINYLTTYFNYLISDNTRPNINKEEVKKIVNNQISKYENENNITISTNEKDNINNVIDENIDKINTILPTKKDLKIEDNMILNSYEFLTSINGILLIGGTLITLSTLLMLINKSVICFFIYNGISLLINGLILLSFGLLGTKVMELLIDNIFITSIIQILLSKILISGIIVFTISLIMIIIYIIMRNKKEDVELNYTKCINILDIK